MIKNVSIFLFVFDTPCGCMFCCSCILLPAICSGSCGIIIIKSLAALSKEDIGRMKKNGDSMCWELKFYLNEIWNLLTVLHYTCVDTWKVLLEGKLPQWVTCGSQICVRLRITWENLKTIPWDWISSTETERTSRVFPGTDTLPSHLHPAISPASSLQKSFSLLGLPQVPKSTFNQRSEKMQKQRKAVKQDKIIIV